MKSVILILIAFIFSFGSCEKETELSSNVIKGKVVHRSCASVVVQVLDEKHQSIGQSEWQQSASKPTYRHVFSVGNKCAFPNLAEGAEFYFKVISEDPTNRDCVTCALFDNPPTKVHLVQVVNKPN